MFDIQPTAVRFQLAWTLLHLAGAAMNLGSAWYHFQRLARKVHR